MTPISKRSPTKFFNWRQYFRDMYVSGVRAVTTAILAFGGTNAAENVAPIAAHGVGLSWLQGVISLVSVLFFDVVRYVNIHPLPPEEIYENENDQMAAD